MQKQQQPFSWPLILSMAIGLAKGMVHLHLHNILHRDLKSLNVLVTSTDPEEEVTVKLMDFGESEETFQYREDNHLCGTIRWMAPEIYKGKPYTPKSDVFSYGIILWELFSLQVPFHEIPRDFQVGDAIANGQRPSFAPDCLIGYRALAQSCWDPCPQSRPTFDEALLVLEELKLRFSS